ncbi:MAG: TonB-dependent receptor [Cyclobacteriaceae bacterium]
MIRNYFTIFLLITVNIGLTAQTLTQTIKGRLIDQQSKTPLVGATIVVANTDPILGTVTDVDGYYKISNVPLGRQTLTFSSVGYAPKTIPNVLVGSGKEVVLDLSLIESLEELKAVEIIASKNDAGQPRNEMATVSAISLSVEETGRMAATFDDPARAALSYAGVATGGDDLLNEIVIRGNSPKGILWRLEGVEIPNPNHFAEVGSSAGGISMLSSNVLASSDFFTAAFPAQYGNATSGIFDLNLRKGNSEEYEHAFQAGLLGVTLASEGPLKKGSRASYLVNYRYSTLGLFNKIGFKILGEQEEVTFQDLSFKFHIPTKKMGSFSVWGLGGDNNYSYLQDTSIQDYWNEYDKQRMGVGGITHVAYLGKETYLESIVSYSASSQVESEDSLAVVDLFEEQINQNTFRVSSFLNHKFNPKNTLRVGGIYSRLNYNLESKSSWETGELVTFLDESGGTDFYQGFAQWQHRFNNDLTFNGGVHVSHFALNEQTYVEPRLGLRWQATDRGAFNVGAGMHSRMESLPLYLAYETQEDGTKIQHNKDLGFTKAAHAVFGYEYQINPKWRVKAEVYYQHLSDVPVWPSDTTSIPELRTFSAINSYDGYTNSALANKGTGENYGIELTLDKRFSDNYYLMSTLSVYESNYKGIDGVKRSTVFDGGYIFNVIGGKEFVLANKNKSIGINSRIIMAGGKRTAPIMLDESIDMGYTIRDYTRNNLNQLDDYFRLDFGINYRKNRPNSSSVVAINVQNILATQNVFDNYYDPAFGKVLDATQLGLFPNLSYKVEF